MSKRKPSHAEFQSSKWPKRSKHVLLIYEETPNVADLFSLTGSHLITSYIYSSINTFNCVMKTTFNVLLQTLRASPVNMKRWKKKKRTLQIEAEDENQELNGPDPEFCLVKWWTPFQRFQSIQMSRIDMWYQIQLNVHLLAVSGAFSSRSEFSSAVTMTVC